jgi:hypothetical protein
VKRLSRPAFALTALAALLAVSLTACSSIDEGYITAKDHREGYYSTWYSSQCTSYDSKGLCRSYVQIPHQQWNPPTWTFSLVEERKGIGEGDRKTGWVNINEDTYGKYEVGDYYPRGKK